MTGRAAGLRPAPRHPPARQRRPELPGPRRSAPGGPGEAVPSRGRPRRSGRRPLPLRPPPPPRGRHLRGAGRPLPAEPPLRSLRGKAPRGPGPPGPAPEISAIPAPRTGHRPRRAGSREQPVPAVPSGESAQPSALGTLRARGARTRQAPAPPLLAHSAVSTYCLVRLLHLRQLQCLQRERAALRSDSRLCPTSEITQPRSCPSTLTARSSPAALQHPTQRHPTTAAHDACRGCHHSNFFCAVAEAWF